jgi:hypothetical protein
MALLNEAATAISTAPVVIAAGRNCRHVSQTIVRA